MNFEEFLMVLNPNGTAKKRYFKPYTTPILNSHHPSIKDEAFAVSPAAEEFKIVYTHRDDGCQEILSQTELEQVFNERGWENFIPYEPDSDLLEWLEHPIWGVYT